MVQRNWSSFTEWKNIVENGGRGLDGPFNDSPLTKDSIYLWNQMSTPLPDGSTHGTWGVFPEPKALAGFLRYIVLPIFFEIWLVREEWDDDPERFIKAEELFAMAEKTGKCRYIEDVPFMKPLIATLDALMDRSNEEVTRGLADVAEKFNYRWEDTSTWCFKIEIHENPVSVGKEIFNCVAEDLEPDYIVEEFGMSEDAWMKICRSALEDESAQAQFIERLKDGGVF